MASSKPARNIVVKGAREHNLKNVDVIITLQPLVGTGNKELTDEEYNEYTIVSF